MRVTRDLRYIAELESEIERLRFFAWSLAVILFATILTIAVVK